MALRAEGDETELSALDGRIRTTLPRGTWRGPDGKAPVTAAQHSGFFGVEISADVGRSIGDVELLDADGKPIAVIHGVAAVRVGQG